MCSVTDQLTDEFYLVGYLRFLLPEEGSGEEGYSGKVISQYADGWADPSDVPVYRRMHQTKADLDNPIVPTCKPQLHISSAYPHDLELGCWEHGHIMWCGRKVDALAIVRETEKHYRKVRNGRP